MRCSVINSLPCWMRWLTMRLLIQQQCDGCEWLMRCFLREFVDRDNSCDRIPNKMNNVIKAAHFSVNSINVIDNLFHPLVVSSFHSELHSVLQHGCIYTSIWTQNPFNCQCFWFLRQSTDQCFWFLRQLYTNDDRTYPLIIASTITSVMHRSCRNDCITDD